MKYIIKILVFLGISVVALANGGDDLLRGTDASWWATFNGTGKHYFYAAEGVIALMAFIKTRNPLVLIGIVVVALFINVVLFFAGQNG